MSEKYQLVINTAIGGFSLSREAILLGRKISGEPSWGGLVLIGDEDWIDCDYVESVQVERHDPILIQVFNKLGEQTSKKKGSLKLIEIDEPEYHLYIDDIGLEHVTPKSHFNFKSCT